MLVKCTADIDVFELFASANLVSDLNEDLVARFLTEELNKRSWNYYSDTDSTPHMEVCSPAQGGLDRFIIVVYGNPPIQLPHLNRVPYTVIDVRSGMPDWVIATLEEINALTFEAENGWWRVADDG